MVAGVQCARISWDVEADKAKLNILYLCLDVVGFLNKWARYKPTILLLIKLLISGWQDKKNKKTLIEFPFWSCLWSIAQKSSYFSTSLAKLFHNCFCWGLECKKCHLVCQTWFKNKTGWIRVVPSCNINKCINWDAQVPTPAKNQFISHFA